MRHIIPMMMLTSILFSCSVTTTKKRNAIFLKNSKNSKLSYDYDNADIKPKIIPIPSPSSIELVPQIPKLQIVDWSTVIMPLVNQLLQNSETGINLDKLFLIDSIQNNTNMPIQTMQATNDIISVINEKNILKLVPKDEIFNARKTLGLSQEDSLVTRSKSIGLARYVKADYLLYLVIYSNKKQSIIEMQLIESKTGEIFWSGTNLIKLF